MRPLSTDPSAAAPVPPEFLAAVRAAAEGASVVTFERFMETALYDPHVGYYRRNRPRIGYGPGTDFLTATRSAPLLGRLAAAACVNLLGGRDPKAHAFIEIGPEPGGGVLKGGPHPFGGGRCVAVGGSLELRGPCVVFSNELFDAQPFRRFRFRSGAWREWGVAVDGPLLIEVEMPDTTGLGPLPPSAPEGYVIDAPVAAARLARTIAAQPWTGLFIAFDYGKTWAELAGDTPAGTARAYHRHVQSNDLLARPGDQDLTCHVCWDWLVESLQSEGFSSPTLESQEAFFMHHASECIASIIEAETAGLSRDKLSLLQLLHPANLGRKFQVLWAVR